MFWKRPYPGEQPLGHVFPSLAPSQETRSWGWIHYVWLWIQTPNPSLGANRLYKVCSFSCFGLMKFKNAFFASSLSLSQKCCYYYLLFDLKTQWKWGVCHHLLFPVVFGPDSHPRKLEAQQETFQAESLLTGETEHNQNRICAKKELYVFIY